MYLLSHSENFSGLLGRGYVCYVYIIFFFIGVMCVSVYIFVSVGMSETLTPPQACPSSADEKFKSHVKTAKAER